MAVNVHLFSLGPADQVSGGFLYNRQLMCALERAGLEHLLATPDGAWRGSRY